MNFVVRINRFRSSCHWDIKHTDSTLSSTLSNFIYWNHRWEKIQGELLPSVVLQRRNSHHLCYEVNHQIPHSFEIRREPPHWQTSGVRYEADVHRPSMRDARSFYICVPLKRSDQCRRANN